MAALTNEEHDNLYHYLRRLSIAGSENEINAVIDLSGHLLGGGDYWALLQYEKFYGESFLANSVHNILFEADITYNRVVEFGAGTGWLGRHLAASAGLVGVMTIDKRPWPRIDLIANLETEEGVGEVLDKMMLGDLVVMCEFLHCVDDAKSFLDIFSAWPRIILERVPSDKNHKLSLWSQLVRFGATPLEHIKDNYARVGEFQIWLLEAGEK